MKEQARVDTLRQVFDQAKRGVLPRDEYWKAMQARYVELRQYQGLIAGNDVRSIEIAADEMWVVTGDGVAMVWDPEDTRTAPNMLINHGDFEPGESRLLLSAGEGAKVIFDVGANAGYYSLHWCSRIHPEGRIHAFEPVPQTFSRLVRNVARNGLEKQIRISNIGLGNEITTTSFFLPKFSGSVAASAKNLHPEEENIEVVVHIDTLDRYFGMQGLNRLDLMKVDVEGAELFVVKGGLDTLNRHKPLVFMELLRKWSKPFGYHPNDVIGLFADMGYACYALADGKLATFAKMTDETTQTNFFFAHPAKHKDWLTRNGF
jgi:FkbM family methyltransferase